MQNLSLSGVLFWAVYRIKDPKFNGIPCFCASNKMFFVYAHSQLQEMGKNWIAQQLQAKAQ